MTNIPSKRTAWEIAVAEELRSARKAFPLRFHSAHEGYAVLLEEVMEVQAETFKKTQDLGRMRSELIQVAAMAQRMAEEVCGEV